MKKHVLILGTLATLVVAGVAAAGGGFNSVKQSNYDPGKTYLVGAAWISGIGCPNNAKTFDGTNTTPYTDAACTSVGSSDPKNMGLLLAKTGPTGNFAAGQVVLKKVPATITELGYDIRKPGGDPAGAEGSHCSAGAPRFDLTDTNGAEYFVGCDSPAPTVTASSTGWMRLRWSPATAYPAAGGGPVAVSTLTVKQVTILIDEGQDTGPDNFGLAVLDNIDVNGTLVGK
jgi:hypothetical protein